MQEEGVSFNVPACVENGKTGISQTGLGEVLGNEKDSYFRALKTPRSKVSIDLHLFLPKPEQFFEKVFEPGLMEKQRA